MAIFRCFGFNEGNRALLGDGNRSI